MRRILVVDDEVLIADGIRDMLQEEKDIEPELYCCYSAGDALELLDRVRIEIVVTDVKMPEMSGVELFEEIRRRWPKCRVIFLTGHQDFEPLYKVSRHKDVHYLLKSEGPERVLETVRRVVKELDDLKTESLSQDMAQRAVGVFRAGVLRTVLDGHYTENKLEELKEETGIDFEKPLFLLFGSPVEQISSHTDFLQGFFGLTELSQRHLGGFCRFALVFTEDLKLIWVLQSMEPERLAIHLPAALELLQTETEELLSFSLQLLFYRKAVELKLCCDTVPRLMKSLNAIGKLGGKLLVLDNIPEKERTQARDSQSEAQRLFLKIDRYINQNLSGELSLTSIAQLVHFNPTYLSKIFKENFRISLSEHISEKRLKEAKRLLINTDKRVQEICELTGNYSLTNFCRFFRNATGLSPQEYRRQGGKGE